MVNNTPDFSPPRSLTIPLPLRIANGISDLVSPEKLPPLQLTSRPVNVGMILGDRLAMPWFRTVFTNVGDVITPETLPPLELQSQPIDVGELLGDQIRKPWWASLVRNIADKIAPERLPALALTSKPTNPPEASQYLTSPQWSELLDLPKTFDPDKPKELERYHGFKFVPAPVQAPVAPDPTRLRAIEELTAQKRRDLRFAHIREALWVSCVLAEAAFLVIYWVRG
jgi:hypothetical protein